jgi:hypothetical protein
MEDQQYAAPPVHRRRRGRLLLSLPLALVFGLGALLVVATPASAQPQCPIVLEPPPECQEPPPPPPDPWMDPGSGGQQPVPGETNPTAPPQPNLRCGFMATAKTQYIQRPTNTAAGRFQFSVDYCLNQQNLIARAVPSVSIFTRQLATNLGTIVATEAVPFGDVLLPSEGDLPVPRYVFTYTLEFTYTPVGGAQQKYQDVVTINIGAFDNFQTNIFTRLF